MDKLVRKLKSIKNITQEQYKDTIEKYAYDEVLNELSELGIEKDDISQDEFNKLLQEQIKKSKRFADGALIATGALLFLELLG